jgi:hypothetical protein
VAQPGEPVLDELVGAVLSPDAITAAKVRCGRGVQSRLNSPIDSPAVGVYTF